MKYLLTSLAFSLLFTTTINAQVMEGCYTEYNLAPTYHESTVTVDIPEVKVLVTPAVIIKRVVKVCVREINYATELQCVTDGQGIIIGYKKCTVEIPAVYEEFTYDEVITPAVYDIIQPSRTSVIPVQTKNEKGGIVRVPCGSTPPVGASLPTTN